MSDRRVDGLGRDHAQLAGCRIDDGELTVDRSAEERRITVVRPNRGWLVEPMR